MMEGKTEETNSKEIDEEVEVESPNRAFEVPEAEYLEEQDVISENEYRVDTGPTVEEVREDIFEIQGLK